MIRPLLAALDHGDGINGGYGVWSPVGDGFGYDVDGVFKNSHWVDHPGAGTSVQLGLPSDRDLSVVGWEGPSTVLLWDVNEYADPPYSTLLRCDAATGACQRVEGGPAAGRPAVLGG